MSKKRKKSLVGWIDGYFNWKMLNKTDFYIPTICKHKNIDLDRTTKVRITIEEI